MTALCALTAGARSQLHINALSLINALSQCVRECGAQILRMRLVSLSVLCVSVICAQFFYSVPGTPLKDPSEPLVMMLQVGCAQQHLWEQLCVACSQ